MQRGLGNNAGVAADERGIQPTAARQQQNPGARALTGAAGTTVEPANGGAFSSQTKQSPVQQQGPDPVRQQERSTVPQCRMEPGDLNGVSGEMLDYRHEQRR